MSAVLEALRAAAEAGAPEDRLIELALERHADKSRSETSVNLDLPQGM